MLHIMWVLACAVLASFAARTCLQPCTLPLCCLLVRGGICEAAAEATLLLLPAVLLRLLVVCFVPHFGGPGVPPSFCV